MNEPKVFSYGQVDLKVKEVNGEIYFDAEQVAIGLGITQIKNGKEYVQWKRVNNYLNGVSAHVRKGNSPQVAKGDFISEPDFYTLAIKANNETAQKFQYWVTHDVLPAIRKTGSYTVPKAKSTEAERQLNRQIRKMYADNRRAELMMRLADAETTTRARKVELRNRAAMILIGPQHSYQEAYTAKYIADRTGVTPKMVGTIANLNHLKAEDGEANEYGHYEYVTNPVTGATYWQWYYNQEGVQRMEELIEGYYVEE